VAHSTNISKDEELEPEEEKEEEKMVSLGTKFPSLLCRYFTSMCVIRVGGLKFTCFNSPVHRH